MSVIVNLRYTTLDKARGAVYYPYTPVASAGAGEGGAMPDGFAAAVLWGGLSGLLVCRWVLDICGEYARLRARR
jgi:hypothetical protein